MRLWEVMEPLRKTHKRRIFDEALTEPAVARIYAVTYQSELSDLWKAHGGCLLFDSDDNLAPPEFDLLRYIVLEAAVFGGARHGENFAELQTLVSLIAGEAEVKGIELRKSSVKPSQRRHREAVGYIEEIFRALWHFSQGGARVKHARVRGYRDALIYILLCLEFEVVVNPKQFGLKYRPGTASRSIKKHREELFGRMIAPQVLRELVTYSDAAAGNVLLQSWLDGALNFVSFEDGIVA